MGEKAETRLTARVLTQDPNRKKIKKNAIYHEKKRKKEKKGEKKKKKKKKEKTNKMRLLDLRGKVWLCNDVGPTSIPALH